MNLNVQRELAQELVDLFHSDGEALDMSVLDLLDNLATLGILLRRMDRVNEASAAYFATLTGEPVDKVEHELGEEA